MSHDANTPSSAQTLGPRKHRALVQQVYESGQDPIALAQAHGLSLGQLIAFAEHPRTRRELAALIGLSDAGAAALLSRFRRTAVTRLARLASGDEQAPPETVRRACNDLLKLEIPMPEAPADSSAEAQPHAEENANRILSQVRDAMYEQG